MRKLIVSTLVSLDGAYGDPGSWATAYFDDEAAEKSLAQLLTADAMLMGRGTYEYFAPVWPAMTGPYPDRINAMQKYVFSSTLTAAEWNNSTIVSGDAVAAVAALKQRAGKDLVIYGYGRLAQTLLEHDLVDELGFGIHPLMLGSGRALFRPGQEKTLRLVSAEPRSNGVVYLLYARA